MSVKDHKCLSCNAELNFDPRTQNWVCEYCGSSYTLKDLKESAEKKAKKEENKSASTTSSYNGYHCPDCGAEIIMDENTSVTECVYCGNTSIITERLEGEFEPKKIIPFKTIKDDAIDAFLKYKKGKIFMPKEFIDKRNIEKISGIYIPFYLYDIDTSGQINVEATRISQWSDSRYRYVKTDYYNVFRSGNMSFNNIPTDASKKFPDDIMDSIEPFNYEDLVDFDSAYISGFLSEKYDLTIDELYERAENRAKKSTNEILLNDIRGYSSRIIQNSESESKRKSSSKYVLLPVWMLNIKYKEKMYTLAMNGQTGKFIGNLPVSWKKVILYWLAFLLGITIIVILINLFI